ncbi:MAG: hypothetical protein HEP71_33450 [Roseivirga sp.]|nr:hypothetical protein [Roseivirga sp.]
MQHKLIGIVGGMGPQAGVALHEAIIRRTPVEKDQDHLSVVLMTYPGEITARIFWRVAPLSTRQPVCSRSLKSCSFWG